MFYFDRGLKFPKDKIANIETESKKYYLPHIQRNKLKIRAKNDYILADLLDFPFGSQGEQVYEAKYKIIWSYMNFQRFHFSDEPLMIDYNHVLISSNHKIEIFYLLAILNSFISTLIFNKLLKLPNEQDILIGIKTIKDFIRIPTITPENQPLKTEITTKVEQLLALEQIKLSDLIDFTNVLVQKFDSLAVENEFLLLKSEDKITQCKIKKNKNLVEKFVKENTENLTLKTLKSALVVDEQAQTALKKEIDDLVFCLYFNTQLTDLEKNKYYQYLQNAKK